MVIKKIEKYIRTLSRELFKAKNKKNAQKEILTIYYNLFSLLRKMHELKFTNFTTTYFTKITIAIDAVDELLQYIEVLLDEDLNCKDIMLIINKVHLTEEEFQELIDKKLTKFGIKKKIYKRNKK